MAAFEAAMLHSRRREDAGRDCAHRARARAGFVAWDSRVLATPGCERLDCAASRPARRTRDRRR